MMTSFLMGMPAFTRQLFVLPQRPFGSNLDVMTRSNASISSGIALGCNFLDGKTPVHFLVRFTRDHCVATDKLWTCAKKCDPSVPSSCPTGYTCDQWGGPPCCYCSAVVPACVPQATTGKIVGPLRINPTSGTAGQKVKLNIQGAPFYIGALF